MTNPSLKDDLDYLKGKVLALEKVLALAIVGFSAGSTRVRGAVEESLEGLLAEAASAPPSRITDDVSSSLDNIRELLGKSASG